ncbi:isoprenyl transferase [Ekhidna lutea]|uniref:isoprenyl transferase n=1 Tax=Ekhidna lutea TaxID=447679 RepID=UPI000B77FBA2|nr:isoprenyl transferase [Ekhidna lutea]
MKNQIEQSNIPEHIAIIMDGNGRWAQKQGVKRIFGHQNAIEAVRSATEGSAEVGVKHLTLYAFSTENWERPKYEVDSLMTLLVNTIKDELPTLQKNNIRLSTIGETSGLPAKAQNRLQEAITCTKENSGMNLILALNYSGKWDLVNAMNQILQKEMTCIEPSDIDEHLSTAGIPNPDLLIRTSGEMRISNFLLWQMAYTELHFTDVLWPDFRKKDLYEAILSYQKRERRFGKTSDQVKA